MDITPSKKHMQTLNKDRMQALLLGSLFILAFYLSSYVYASIKNNTPFHCDRTLQQRVTSNTIGSVEDYATQLHCPIPTINVCIVFDIDNTLITNNPNFGDEAWGSWQHYLKKNNPTSPDLITNWLHGTELYDSEIAFRYLMNFKPVENITISSLHNLQNKYHTIALTARSFASLATTERQLTSNHMNFKLNPIGDGLLNNVFLQQNKNQRELKMYYNGIYYTAGDNKGENLLSLIEYYRTKLKQPNLCSTVIILDDMQSNIDDITNALKNKIGYVGIHYTALPKASEPANWTPALWQEQALELRHTLRTFNRR